MAMKNHENTLNRKIDEHEYNLEQFRLRCQTQQEEIVKLRSRILQQSMEKELDDTKIESVVKNEKETKQMLMKVTENLQGKDHALS
mmetsp:Transcript_31016/g.41119  ORF Transcript_31016/g.41119 Transcript_31016/m.41119 type:complete len:86 (-) Transcript_31016:494-751(-)